MSLIVKDRELMFMSEKPMLGNANNSVLSKEGTVHSPSVYATGLVMRDDGKKRCRQAFRNTLGRTGAMT